MQACGDEKFQTDAPATGVALQLDDEDQCTTEVTQNVGLRTCRDALICRSPAVIEREYTDTTDRVCACPTGTYNTLIADGYYDCAPCNTCD
eukprot:SAG31_NODE_18348_length_639_cov_1.342593_1_plen_90_part_01